MKLPILHESVILIDGEFLIKKIKENYDFYSDLYPDKEFNNIRLVDIIEIVASSSKIIHPYDSVNVIILYRLSNSVLPYTSEPNNLFVLSDYVNMPMGCKINECNFDFASFFSNPDYDDDYNYYEEFNQLLNVIAYDGETFSISLVADNEVCNYPLEEFDDMLDKSFFIFRGTDYEIGINGSEKINYVNFDYVIAMCMGLRQSEW
jgi:hypothetical protein